MSVRDPIALCERSQVFFEGISGDFPFFCINQNFLSEKIESYDDSIRESFDFINPLPSKTLLNSQVYSVKFVHFLKVREADVFCPFYGVYKPIFSENKLISFKFFYYSLYAPPPEFLVLPQEIFNSLDRNQSELNFNICYQFLKNRMPYHVFNEKEWWIGWLMLFDLTAKKISFITGISINYVERLSKSVLDKTKTYNKNLYSKVGGALGWKKYIPHYQVSEKFILIKTVYKNSPRKGLT